MKIYEGECCCGNIAYRFDGEPINSVFCYCSECQKSTGSDKFFGVWVPADKFNFTKGQVSTFTRTGDSGKDMNYKFCSNCSITLCAEVTMGNFYSIAASTVISSNDFFPKMCIYTTSAPEWAVYPTGVPKFNILPPDLEV